MSKTLSMFNFANIATTTSGNKNLIPNTAIKIPQVINLCRHFSDIPSSFIALTTALSNDKLISKTASTNAINIQAKPVPP